MVRRRATPRANRGGRKSAVKPVLEDNDDRRFVRPNAISPHLFCPICTEVFNHPYRAPCGHSFCFTHVVRASLHHDFILESIIGDYSVACPWRSLGCSFIGALHLLASHKKNCVMNPDLLPEALRVRELQALQRASSSSQLSEMAFASSTTSSNNTASTNTTTFSASEIDAAVETPRRATASGAGDGGVSVTIDSNGDDGA
ncbi:unnamed protein product, partial [Dibothriocephalus latus]